MKPLVTIIIPLYNRSTIIGETIDSILNQTYQHIEVIVIDDQSTDNSLQIAKSYESISNKIKVIQRQSSETKGANSCRNIGLSLAKGQYVKWIDSDDVLNLNIIELQVDDIIKSKSDISVCRAKKFIQRDLTLEKEWLEEWGNINNKPSVENFCSYKFIWHTSAGLWDINFLKKTSNWDIYLMNSQEWLFHLTALANGATVSTINEYGSFIRMHENSMSHHSNKKGKYYYHECLARYKAMNILYKKKHKEIKSYLLLFKKFRWYQLFTFYKGSSFLGIKLFVFYPNLFQMLILIKSRK